MKSKLTKAQKRQRKRIADMKAQHAMTINILHKQIKNLEAQLNERRKSFYTYSDHMCMLRSELVKTGYELKLDAMIDAREQPIHIRAENKIFRDTIKGFKIGIHREWSLRRIEECRKGELLPAMRHQLREAAQQLSESFVIQILQLLPEIAQ